MPWKIVVQTWLPQLRATLQHDIPLTTALGLQVAGIQDGCLVLAAPFAPNSNHRTSVFAGSLNAVVTVAGWSVVWLVLAEAGLQGQIVIQDSEIHYRTPVRTDFTARCCVPERGQVEEYLRRLRRKGRARLALDAEAWDATQLCVTFHARYVVQLAAPTPFP